MKAYPKVLPLIALLLCAIVVTMFWLFNYTTTVMLVRHAERSGDSSNSNLSTEGLDRADQLIEAVNAYDVAGIYSTNFCRTAQTAQPLAVQLSLPLQVQQISSSGGLTGCDPTITIPWNNLPAELNEEAAFVDYLLDQHKGQTVLVVGHSNTTPALVNALGSGIFDVPQIAHDKYDNLFIVRIHNLWGEPELVNATYGD